MKKLFYITIFFISTLSFTKIILSKFNINTSKIIEIFLNETTNKTELAYDLVAATISKPYEIVYKSLNKIVPKDNIEIYSNVEDDVFDYSNANTDYIEDPNPTNYDNPIIYIYNTHQLEEYTNNKASTYSISPNVMMASYMIKEHLTELGIPSIVETGNIKEYLNKNSLNYSYSYEASKYYMLETLKKYDSIKYLVDIHRDSATIDKTLLKKDGKEYARILFIVGLDNENYEPNLEITTKLNEMFESNVSGISRGILKKSGKGVNGVYNQDVSSNTILIEVGGVDNTIEQVNNTCELIAKVLKDYIEENDG